MSDQLLKAAANADDLNPFENMVTGTGSVADPEDSEVEVQSGIQLANFNSGEINMASEDLMIPRLRLTQGLTQEVQDGSAKPGQWILAGYPAYDEVVVVPLMFARNRALRDEEGSIMCKSTDSLIGVGEPGGDCSACLFNKWTEGGKNGKNLPPKCSFSYVYICYVKEYDTMALVEFRRTSITAGKMLNTLVAQRKLGNFAVKLCSTKQTGNKGTFYSIVVKPTATDSELLGIARGFMGQ
jgi:hypothetical protein